MRSIVTLVLPDVNVLLHAMRNDSPYGDAVYDWLCATLQGEEDVLLWDVLMASVVRVSTHPRVYRVPSTTEEALAFVDAIQRAPRAVVAGRPVSIWPRFSDLIRVTGARGNLVTDAMIVAFAIEHGCTVVTFDRDFARFPGLRWSTPPIR